MKPFMRLSNWLKYILIKIFIIFEKFEDVDYESTLFSERKREKIEGSEVSSSENLKS